MVIWCSNQHSVIIVPMVDPVIMLSTWYLGRLCHTQYVRVMVFGIEVFGIKGASQQLSEEMMNNVNDGTSYELLKQQSEGRSFWKLA